MENDDLLDDLLSWTDNSSATAQKGGLTPSRDCVNVRLGESPGKTDHRPTTPQPITTSLPDASHPPLELPPALTEKLFDYQREGIQWLYRKHCTGRACLLADEMGLGKTVQVGTFLGALFRQKMIKTAIIIVPPTLVPMWSAALENWGDLKPPLVEILHNESKAKRQARWRRLGHGLPTVFLTTYGVLRQDVRCMSAQMVDYVVLDEAHLIKDASTQASKSAMDLSARHKIALTGTPLMNSFEDMWSIFCFLDGGIIDQSRADFRSINQVLLRGNERDASMQQRSEAEAALCRLQTAIVPYMLRREKRDVQAVRSQKQDTVVWVRLTEIQRRQYEAFLHTKEVEASRAVRDEMEEGESEAGGPNPLMLLTMLGQICNHPWLNLTDDALRDAIQKPFEVPCEAVGDILSGAKLSVALSLTTRAINDGRKVLIFSRSKVLLSLFSCRLSDWHVPHARIDGDCNSEDRFARVNDFNKDPLLRVCLLTTQVGGVGLTFDSASCVVLMDPSWNPSADAQAVDRVHRIGQTRDVVVYRLVTSGTVEEKIYRNQVFKTMAAKQSTTASTEQTNDLFRYFTRIQLRSMFELGNLDSSETADQLAQLHPGMLSPEMQRLPDEVPFVCAVSDNGCVLSDDVVLDEVQAELDESLSLSQGSVRAKRARTKSATPPPPPQTSRSFTEASDDAGGASGADDNSLAPMTRLRRTELSPPVTATTGVTLQEEVAAMVVALEAATAALTHRERAPVEVSTSRVSECVRAPESDVSARVDAPPTPPSAPPRACLPCVPAEEVLPVPLLSQPEQPEETKQVLGELLAAASTGGTAVPMVPDEITARASASGYAHASEPNGDDNEDALEDPAQPQAEIRHSPQKVLSHVLGAFRHIWS